MTTETSIPQRAGDDDLSFIDRLKRRFLYGLGLGIAVVIAITFLGDGPALLRTMGQFAWWWLPLILGLILANYALRFLKWELYLRWLNIGQVPRRTSLGIFLAGMSMAITPGKVGEFLKAYLLRRAVRVPVAVSAPIVFAERVTDGIAMLGLAAVGLFSVHYGWQVLLVLAALAAGGILLLHQRSLMLRLLARLEHAPLMSGRAHALQTLYESTYVLFQPGILLGAVGIGMVSWFGESLAFFLILVGLGFAPTLHLLIMATFILATATLLGSISMLPGGLGAAEASVAGLLLLVIHDARMTHDLAAAATLMVRVLTLWFGVLLGLGALLLVERHLQGRERQAPPAELPQAAD